MAIQRINVKEFLALAVQHPVLDVRSPGEYAQACIPGAVSMPLFTDEERKEVGTAYKQQGRQPAIKIGLDYFGPNMRRLVEQAEAVAKGSNTILVHCWRGGMRSGAVAWLLDLYGFKVYTLAGGYKAFRNWVLQQCERPWQFRIIGGYTGSGKTQLLQELAKYRQVVDLEGLANHKGSAFGGLGEKPQPRPEMFENLVAVALSKMDEAQPIWMEDESRRIGDINLQQSLWHNMRRSPVFFLDIPFEERLTYITAEYGKFRQEDLINATVRIQKRLGGLNAKNVIGYLLEKNNREAFSILLAYYDKFYGGSLQTRENLQELLTKVPCDTVDAKANMRKLLEAHDNAAITPSKLA